MSETSTPSGQRSCLPSDCTGTSSALDEPLLGTAPHAVAWLLLVHPGPWSADAPGALLDPAITDELSRRCDEHRVRLAAIRQRAVPTRDTASTTCYVAGTRPGRTWLERLDLADDKGLLDLDVEAVASGSPPGGEPVTAPMFAVCTHGKRDACCAAHGRSVQRAMSLLAPGRVWEATHLGGHRFAANVLALPEGLLYGRVDRNNVRTLVAAHARREISPDRWRGRTAHPQPAQAAEWFLRHQQQLRAIDGVAIEALDREPVGWTVVLRAADRRWTAHVERADTGCARLTSCTGTTADPGRWRLLSLV